MAAVFAWEKAVGDQDELDWWQRRPWTARGGCEVAAAAVRGYGRGVGCDAALAYGPMARHLVARAPLASRGPGARRRGRLGRGRGRIAGAAAAGGGRGPRVRHGVVWRGRPGGDG